MLKGTFAERFSKMLEKLCLEFKIHRLKMPSPKMIISYYRQNLCLTCIFSDAKHSMQKVLNKRLINLTELGNHSYKQNC